MEVAPVHSRGKQSLRNSENMEEDRVRSESECLSTSDVSTQDETHEAGQLVKINYVVVHCIPLVIVNCARWKLSLGYV